MDSKVEKRKIFSPPNDQNPAIQLIAGHNVVSLSLTFTCRYATDYYYYYSFPTVRQLLLHQNPSLLRLHDDRYTTIGKTSLDQ
jgi:hypothetical protein